MARPTNFYSTDYEDTGGESAIDKVISQVTGKTSAPDKTSTINFLTNQILSQGTTGEWTGTGLGSAEANARDMARILADTGITDISQFGKITKTIPAHEVTEGSGENSYQVTVPEQTITTYGNKTTGQEVANTYSERQTGNAFGGTFEGSGNTGYRVNFDPNGTPIFYTTKASSNDLFNILADNPVLNVAATVAANYFGGPAGVAALNAAQGKSAKDVAKATALSYAGNELSKVISPYISTPNIASTASNAEIVAATDLASNMVDSGMSASQIGQQLESAGYHPEAVKFAVEDAQSLIAASTQPSTQPSTQVSQPVSQTVEVTAPAKQALPVTTQDVINAISQPTNQQVVVTAPTQQEVATAAGFPSLNAYNLFNGNINAYNEANTLAINANKMAVKRMDADMRYDVNNDGRVTSADALLISKGTPLRQLETAKTVEVTAQNKPVQQTPTISDVITSIATQPVTQAITQTNPTVQVTAQNPTVQNTTTQQTPTLGDVISTIATQPIIQTGTQVTPTVQVTGQSPTTQTNQQTTDVANAVIQSSVTNPTTLPTVVVTGTTPQTTQDTGTTVTPIVTSGTPLQTQTIISQKPSSIKEGEVIPATIVPSSQIDTTIPAQEKKWTAAELAELAKLGLLASTVLGVTSSSSGPTQYGIVPVPADWKSPVYQKDLPVNTGASTTLPPIDFGTRDLLKGTQWEKFLDPNYGKIQEPKVYSQPSQLSYQDLMGILGSKSGMPPASELSINDVISGIQNQYGKTP
jgi:hypothetical protein